MISRLLFPDWCYVVRSDRRIVTVPPTSRLERWLHFFVWDSLTVIAAHVRSMAQLALRVPR